MKDSIRYVIVLVCLLHAAAGFSQERRYTTNVNGWLSYTGSHKLSPKWGIHLEEQIRRHDVVVNWQQYMFRTGINYHFNDQVSVTAGYAFIETYPYGEFHVSHRFPEHRAWEQLQIRQFLGRSEWIHRFRLEQRMMKMPVADAASDEPFVYSNRMRFMHRISIPIGAHKIDPNTFFVSFFDEIMIAFGREVRFNVFNQNRAYAALGYRFPRLGRLEVGYLNQLDFKADGIRVENNHTIQVSLMSSLDFFRKEKSTGAKPRAN